MSVLWRVLAIIPVWLAVAVTVFALVRLVPGDAALLIAGSDSTAEQVAAIRRDLGLDLPAGQQFLLWFGRVLRGDLGRSLVSKESVAVALRERAPVSVQLALAATLITVLIAIPSGVVAATQRGRVGDHAVMGLALFGICIPSFVMGMLLMLVGSVWLGWFPIRGYAPLSQGFVAWARHMALPALAYGLIETASVARMTRSAVLEVLNQEYVRTARTKGLAERVVLCKHVLRNAMIPIITVIGLNIGILFAGAVVIEMLFGLPGLGSYLVGAIRSRDYPVVQGEILVIATALVVINLLVDLSYRWIDPRIRYS